jgi:hypothetical protein
MRIRTADTLALLVLSSALACGGSTVKSADDSGLRDEDAGVTQDGGTKHADTGAPGSDAQKPNDGGIVNDAAPGECPATYAIAAMAAVCNGDVPCIYDEGTCVCGEPGPPHEGPDDWFCTARSAGCPYAPPATNSACSDSGLYCDYGACSGGTAWDCSGGVWTQGAVGCPQ